MPAITIRDVPDETRDDLAARAAASGRSLQEYLRMELIELARRPDTATLAADVRARKELARTRLPGRRIIELRNADRR